MNATYKKIIFGAVVIILFVSFQRANAMEIYFEKDQKQTTDKEIVFDVFLDSGDQEINVVEGKIKLEGVGIIQSLKTEKSILSLWPQEPKITKDEIEFVGGTPSGVFGNKLKLFSFQVKPYDSGEIKLSFSSIDVFLNDGLGTKVIAIAENYKFNIDKSAEKPDNNWFKNMIGVIILLVILLVALFLRRKK